MPERTEKLNQFVGFHFGLKSSFDVLGTVAALTMSCKTVAALEAAGPHPTTEYDSTDSFLQISLSAARQALGTKIWAYRSAEWAALPRRSAAISAEIDDQQSSSQGTEILNCVRFRFLGNSDCRLTLQRRNIRAKKRAQALAIAYESIAWKEMPFCFTFLLPDSNLARLPNVDQMSLRDVCVLGK